MKNIFTHDNFKKACEWVWDKKYYILMIVIIVFLVITQFKSCQKYKDLKTISDNNIIALTDSVHHYKTKNGELAASKVLLLGDIETLKLANGSRAAKAVHPANKKTGKNPKNRTFFFISHPYFS